jgi:plasmid stabilization system protein ParE
MNYKVLWNISAENDLSDILDYIIENDDINNAHKIYLKIKERAELLSANPQQGRIVPELKSLGDKYREIIIKPWRIIYSIDNKQINILLVIDGRRDLEEILFELIVKIDRA